MTSRAQAGASEGDNAAANTRAELAPKNPDPETLIGEWERRTSPFSNLPEELALARIVSSGDDLAAALREAEKEREEALKQLETMHGRAYLAEGALGDVSEDNRKLREALRQFVDSPYVSEAWAETIEARAALLVSPTASFPATKLDTPPTPEEEQ